MLDFIYFEIELRALLNLLCRLRLMIKIQLLILHEIGSEIFTH